MSTFLIHKWKIVVMGLQTAIYIGLNTIYLCRRLTCHLSQQIANICHIKYLHNVADDSRQFLKVFQVSEDVANQKLFQSSFLSFFWGVFLGHLRMLLYSFTRISFFFLSASVTFLANSKLKYCTEWIPYISAHKTVKNRVILFHISINQFVFPIQYVRNEKK